MDHLWYLSERLVPLCLFSDNTLTSEKKVVLKAVLNSSKKPASNEMCMPEFRTECSTTIQLKDFVGPDSWTFFELLSLNHTDSDQPSSSSSSSPLSFLSEHPSSWSTSPSYIKMKEIVESLPVVNDAAERALGLITEFHQSNCPKNEDQKQFLCKVVKQMRVEQAKQATSTERITKKALL